MPTLLRRARALLAAGVTIGGLAALPAAPASAAVPTCDGLPATIVATGAEDTVRGTEGDDVIVGTADPEEIEGLGGDDVICGGWGDDLIKGGPGDDRLFGQGGGYDEMLDEHVANTVVGGPGSDLLVAASPGSLGAAVWYDEPAGITLDLRHPDADGYVAVRTSTGADRVLVRRGTWFEGSDHDDTMIGGPGPDDLFGGLGDDRLVGGGGDDLLTGYAGDDVVRGGPGDDDLEQYGPPSGPGRDGVVAGAGADTVVLDDRGVGPGTTVRLGSGDDLVRGVAPGRLTLDGGPGRDSVRLEPWHYRHGATSVVDHGATRWHVTGLAGTVRLRRLEVYVMTQVHGRPLRGRFLGSARCETVVGALHGPLVARGHGGRDQLHGTRARDLLDGGPGRDAAYGGAGRDRCPQVEQRHSCESRR